MELLNLKAEIMDEISVKLIPDTVLSRVSRATLDGYLPDDCVYALVHAKADG